MGAVRVRGQTNCRSVGLFGKGGGRATGPTKLLFGLAILFLATSCGLGPDPRLLDVGNVDLSPKQPVRMNAGTGTTRVPAGKGTYQIYPGDDSRSLKHPDVT